MAQGLRALGWEVPVHRLGAGFPFPTPAEVGEARALLASLPAQAITVIDGLALAPLASVLEDEAQRLRTVALVHHPLALETGLSPAQRRHLDDWERRALRVVRGVLATSRHTAIALMRAGLPPARVGVATPGTDPAPLAGVRREAVPSLLCVASLTPRKGHDLLLRALARVRHHPWRLTCIGAEDRDLTTARETRGLARRLGLATRVRFLGEVDDRRLRRAYAGADLFVLASRHEGYGMALAEALARGVPVVSTRAGAIPETVPPGAGLLVRPGSVRALAEALDRALSDGNLRRRLAAGARVARRRLPDWTQASRKFAAELTRLGAG